MRGGRVREERQLGGGGELHRVEEEVLGGDGHGGVRLDEALQVGGRIRHRDAVNAVTAADAEDHRGACRIN